jgi:hypothetical protein
MIIQITVVVLAVIWKYPKTGLWMSLIMGFLSSGISRYVAAPWG